MGVWFTSHAASLPIGAPESQLNFQDINAQSPPPKVIPAPAILYVPFVTILMRTERVLRYSRKGVYVGLKCLQFHTTCKNIIPTYYLRNDIGAQSAWTVMALR